MKKIQLKYRLSDLFKFRHNNMFIYFSLKAMDTARMDKIMKSSSACNLHSWLFYRHIWFPISDTIDSNGEKVCAKPKFIGLLKSCQLEGTYSKPHANLFNINQEHLAGRDDLRVATAVIDER